MTARDGTMVAVFTVLGRTFMKPVDCPFRASDRMLDQIGRDARVVIVDVHAEATSDKQLLAAISTDGSRPFSARTLMSPPPTNRSSSTARPIRPTSA